MLYRGCSVDYKTSQPLNPPQHKTVTHTHHRPDQTQLVSVPPRLRDLIGVPFGSAPVQRLARVDQVVEGTHCLLHGRVPVRAVGIDQVDMAELQSLEAHLHALDDVFP
jgi:hypothetical protein